MSPSSILLPRLLLLTCCLATLVLADNLPAVPKNVNISQPPTLKKWPEKEIGFRVGDRVELACEAEGHPPVSYKWFKDEKELKMGGGVLQKPGKGTIVLPETVTSQAGEYQCKANNSLGTAVTDIVHLRKFMIEPFPKVKVPKIHKPEVGASQMLECNPAPSYPVGNITWAVADSSDYGAVSVPVDISKRLAQDFEGHLFLANVVKDDGVGGKVYICVVNNLALRLTSRGDDQRLIPQEILTTPDYRAPSILWSSDRTTIGIKGRPKKLKCIFGGYPTPNVTWIKKGEELAEGVKIQDYGRELFIPKVDHHHLGKYECQGRNSKVDAPVTREFTLFVESPPVWIEEIHNQRVAIDDNVTFKCQAAGAPAPKISWYIDGVPVTNTGVDGHRTIGKHTFSLRKVSKSDSMVLQCRATNQHGHLFSNAYLNVLAVPPSITEPMKPLTKVAERQNITMSCPVFGAPTPEMQWVKKDENGNYIDVLDDARSKILSSGDLFIQGAMDTDEGFYTCVASNKFASINQTGHLVVQEPTEILTSPKPKNVLAGEDVVFECDAETDPEEEGQLRVKWLRDGKAINYEEEPRFNKNSDTNALHIKMVEVDDTTRYTCVAENDLDSDEASAQLTVRDRPDPPYNVYKTKCMSDSARVTWLPGNSNNEEIKKYEVYYNTSYDKPGKYHLAGKTRPGRHYEEIKLAPYAKYTFHVVAFNDVGKSDRSMFTVGPCETPAARPQVNPRKLCTAAKGAGKLTITWEPMQQLERNGPDFYYSLGYKRRYETDYTEVTIRDGDVSRYVVEDVEVFVPFNIFIQSGNAMGRSYNKLKLVAFSGEDEPVVEPSNFGLDPDFEVNDTSAVFVWDRVDNDPNKIRGYLKGYQIIFWRPDDPDVKRAHDIFHDKNFKRCMKEDIYRRDFPEGHSRFSRSTNGPIVKGHVHNLWPYSEIEAGILVMNGATSGPLSPTITFKTKEGVPGKVGSLDIVETGSHHLTVEWTQPEQHNGVLTGYLITYQSEDDYEKKTIDVYDRHATKKKIRRLTNDTTYIITVQGKTQIGAGEELEVQGTTLSLMAPDIPKISKIETGDDFFNVSWTPTDESLKEDGKPNNPGTDFALEYKLEKETENWTRTPFEHDKNWINVTGLDYGDEYEVRVVARNGVGDEETSKKEKVTVGKTEEESKILAVASATWFIILMCIILLLLLILIIVCLIRRNRGGKYPVSEKEKLRGKQDPEKDDLNAPFGEYTRTPYVPLQQSDTPEKKSQLSLTDDAPPGSETDSMAEYYETDPSKFNEDGSFIGQYGGKGNKRDSRLGDQDVNSPNALSTFV